MKNIFLLAALILGIIPWSSSQNALNFDGEDDFVQTEYTGVLGANDRTFEAWVFLSTDTVVSNHAILDYGQNLAGSRNTFNIDDDGKLRFTSGGTNANIASVDSAPFEQWTHVAFVLEAEVGYLYINGIEVGSGSLSSVDTPTGAQFVTIGQRVQGGNIPFNGNIDEVRIWDVARTAAEIQASMNGEFCTEQPNLQLYLKLNEGIAGGVNTGTNLALDNSGNSYHGVLNDFSLTGAKSNWTGGAPISDGTSTTTIQENACDSFFFAVNSTTYTTSGVFTEVLAGANAQGCDSIVTLDLTIITVDASVTQDGLVLTANETGAAYQWVSCPDMAPVDGATSQTFTPTISGEYAVIVTNGQNQCTMTSDCYLVTVVATIENEFGDDLVLFPNPTSGEFSIDLGNQYTSARITIKDLYGKLIQSNTYNNRQLMNLNLQEPSGVYLLIVESEGKRAVIRLVKK